MMKRVFVLVVFGLTFVVSGCGSGEKTVYSGDGGTVSTDANGNTTIKNKDGSTVDIRNNGGGFSAKSSDGTEANINQDGTMTGKNAKGEEFSMGSLVSEADLGVPYYPSSTASNRDVRTEEGGKKHFMSIRTTSDSAAKVAAFYKEKVKDPVATEMGKLSSVSGKLEDGREVAVMANEADGKTEVTVSVSEK